MEGDVIEAHDDWVKKTKDKPKSRSAKRKRTAEEEASLVNHGKAARCALTQSPCGRTYPGSEAAMQVGTAATSATAAKQDDDGDDDDGAGNSDDSSSDGDDDVRVTAAVSGDDRRRGRGESASARTSGRSGDTDSSASRGSRGNGSSPNKQFMDMMTKVTLDISRRGSERPAPSPTVAAAAPVAAALPPVQSDDIVMGQAFARMSLYIRGGGSKNLAGLIETCPSIILITCSAVQVCVVHCGCQAHC